jgi:Ca2+-binding RTX toxin-like protein
LSGSTGSDSLAGGDQTDILEGGAGADTLNGGNGTDTLSYEHSSGAVNVDLFLNLAMDENPFNFTADSDADGDQISGFENLIGSQHNDSLFGNDSANAVLGMGGSDLIEGDGGNDTLFGDGGNDTIMGGNDDDVMVGGTDADTFRFDVTSVFGEHGGDVIMDFNINEDRLQIEGLLTPFSFLGDGTIDDLEITQVGANTVITYDLWEGSITLNNVNMNDLLANAENVFTFIG